MLLLIFFFRFSFEFFWFLIFIYYCLFVLFFVFNLFFSQLRVIRAFRSTLEDLEERRSVHSLHSLRSLRNHQLNPHMGYFSVNQKNLTPLSAHQQYQQLFQRNQDNVNGLPATTNLSEISFIDEDPNVVQAENGSRGHFKSNENYNDDLPRPVHETRI